MKMGNVERLTFLTDMVGEQPELRVEAAYDYQLVVDSRIEF